MGVMISMNMLVDVEKLTVNETIELATLLNAKVAKQITDKIIKVNQAEQSLTRSGIEQMIDDANNKLFIANVKKFDQIDDKIKQIENILNIKSMENKTEQAPPLGLMPIREWQFARKLAIEAAILRHVVAGYEVQDGWIKELNELNEILAKS